MPRPRKHRACREFNGQRVFKPIGIPMNDLEVIRLRLDELEAMRLCDLDDKDQSAAGQRMGVSRGTIQRLLSSGRAKLLRSLTESTALIIEEDDSHATVRSDY